MKNKKQNVSIAGLWSVCIVLIGFTAQANASCLISEHATLEGSWGGGNYQGGPSEWADIIYVPPESKKVTQCTTERRRGGFPFYGIVVYEKCKTSYTCTEDFFMGWITYFTFGRNHVQNELAKGVIHSSGDWVYFDIESSDSLRFWLQTKNNTSNQATLVKEAPRYSGKHTWSTLNRK